MNRRDYRDPPPSEALEQLVLDLRESREKTHNVRHRGSVRELPSRDAIVTILQELSAALFPTHFGRYDLSDSNIDDFVRGNLTRALGSLTEQVRRGSFFVADDADADALLADPLAHARNIVSGFAAELAALRALLVSDFRAAYRGDPAATSISEVLLCYPGALAVIYHRLAHTLYRLGARFIARMISDIARSATGIEIHPAAQIGGSFFIDHGSGVVIGETAIIGQNVRLYQAVTLGAKSFVTDEDGALVKGQPRHPIVEDDVVIYAGATVLGRITIGRGSSIGGNVWLTHSVPPGSNIRQARMQNET